MKAVSQELERVLAQTPQDTLMELVAAILRSPHSDAIMRLGWEGGEGCTQREAAAMAKVSQQRIDQPNWSPLLATPALCWVAFSPDETRIASASSDTTVNVWNASIAASCRLVALAVTAIELRGTLGGSRTRRLHQRQTASAIRDRALRSVPPPRRSA